MKDKVRRTLGQGVGCVASIVYLLVCVMACSCLHSYTSHTYRACGVQGERGGVFQMLVFIFFFSERTPLCSLLFPH